MQEASRFFLQDPSLPSERQHQINIIRQQYFKTRTTLSNGYSLDQLPPYKTKNL